MARDVEIVTRYSSGDPTSTLPEKLPQTNHPHLPELISLRRQPSLASLSLLHNLDRTSDSLNPQPWHLPAFLLPVVLLVGLQSNGLLGCHLHQAFRLW